MLIDGHIDDMLAAANIRLAGSSDGHEGRLEVFYNGSWGTVCGDLFGDVAASVACSQLDLG